MAVWSTVPFSQIMGNSMTVPCYLNIYNRQAVMYSLNGTQFEWHVL
jgi:hypothetical protein